MSRSSKSNAVLDCFDFNFFDEAGNSDKLFVAGSCTLALLGILSAFTVIYLLYKGETIARLDDMLTDIEDAVEVSTFTSFNVYTLDVAIYFEQAVGEVEVYDVVGKLVYQGEDAFIKVPQGVYTVIEGDTSIKLKVE